MLTPGKHIGVTGKTADTEFVRYDGHMNISYDDDTGAISGRIVKAALKVGPINE